MTAGRAEDRPRDRLGRVKPLGTEDERLYPRGAASAAGSAEAALAVVELCREERFWEAHEFLERAWNLEPAASHDRDFWKGLTQLAVACCHAQRGNATGAARLLDRAAVRLSRYPSPHRGVDVGAALARAAEIVARLRVSGASALGALPPLLSLR